MAYDNAGNYVRVTDWTDDRDAGIRILADRHDLQDDDFAAALSQVICRDGQSTITADISMNGHRLTDVADPVDAQDAVTRKYVDDKTSYDDPLTINGNNERGRLIFSGAQSALATGKPLGFTFNQADMFFGVKPTDVTVAGDLRRFIWNNKFDGSGTDIMTLDRDGLLTMLGGKVKKTTTPTLTLELDKNAANADVVGNLDFNTKNSSGDLKTWGRVAVAVSDRVVGTEDGSMFLQILKTGTFTTAMTLDAMGITAPGWIKSSSGKLIAQGDTNPAVTCFSPAQGYAGALWLGTDNALKLGQADGNGNPLVIHMSVSAALLHHIGAITSGASITATDAVYAVGGTMGMFYTGYGTAVQFASGWVFNFASATGDLTWSAGGTGPYHTLHANGNLTISGATASKATAGSWVAISDARLKNVGAPYEPGLAELLQIVPKHYALKTAPEVGYVGLIAQEAEAVMPDLVSKGPGTIDGQAVTDLRSVDTTNLLYAAINAIRELNARIAVLETALNAANN